MAKTSVLESSAHPHTLLIRDREHTEITGVTEICAFDESQVLLITAFGRMRIAGKGLKVTSLLPQENKAMIEGAVDSISYAAVKLPRIFTKSRSS